MRQRSRIIDTGIIRTREVTPGDDVAKFCRLVRRLAKSECDLVGRLRHLRARAEAVRMRYCPTAPLTAMNDAWPPITEDAAMLIYEIDALEGLERLTPEEIDMLGRGYLIGMHKQRMEIRPFETHARRGRKQLEAASRGGKTRAARAPAAQALNAMRTEFVEMRARNPGLSRSRVGELVGKIYGVSGRTVLRRLKMQKA